MKGRAPLLRVEEMKANLRALRGARVASLRVMLARRPGVEMDVVHGLLEVKGGRVHRFFLDAGVMLWEEIESLEKGDTDPAEADSPGAYELRAIPVEGAIIATAGVAPTDEGARLELRMEDGSAVVFQSHDEGGEMEHVTWTLTGPRAAEEP